MATQLAGYAFLSTPFVAIRPRRHAARFLFALLFFPIAAWSAFAEHTFKDHFWWHLFAFYTPLILSTLVYFKVRAAEARVDFYRLAWQTADLPSHNYIFLRVAGDEAAAALSFAQFVGWASVWLAGLSKVLVRPIFARHWSPKIVSAGLLWSVVAVCAIAVIRLFQQGVVETTAERFSAMIKVIGHGEILLSLLLMVILIVTYVSTSSHSHRQLNIALGTF